MTKSILDKIQVSPASVKAMDHLGKQYSFRDPELRRKAAAAIAVCRSAARFGRLTKLATLGGDPEESFEQAFASLGFSYIKDKAPRLLDYMAGFQLVDRNEDNTKAVGVFGFRLGKQWVYAPIFFLNGDIKGHELLYLKGRDLFIPMKENWVSYLLAKKPHIIGEQTPESLRSIGVMQPDVRNMSIPPYYSKYSEHRPQWYREFLPTLGKITTQRPSEKYAGLDDRLSVPILCSEKLSFARMMRDVCADYPELNRLCNDFYGKGWLKQSLETLKDKATKEIEQVGRYGNVLGDTIDNDDRNERQEKKEEVTNKDASFVLSGIHRRKVAAGPPIDIKMHDDLTLTCNDPDLSEEDRKKLYSQGYLVRDYRKGDEVSKPYSTQRKAELVNPDASGIYDVLTKPGEFVELLVVNEPQTAKGKCDFATVVRVDGPKNWVNVHRTTLWTMPQRRSNGEQREWFDSLDDIGKDDLNKHDAYMVISVSAAGNIEGSTPFYVNEDLGDGRYKVHWLDHSDKGRPLYLRNPNHRKTDYVGGSYWDSAGGNFGLDDSYHGHGDLLFLTDREGTRFKSSHGTLFAPSRKCKVIRVKKTRDDECGCYHSETPAVEPGDWGDLHMQILQKTAEMKIYCDGESASINAGPLITKKAALFELVRDYGLREKHAKHMIREAEASRRQGKPATYRIKFAQGYPMLGPGPTAPAIQDPQFSRGDGYGSYPTQYMQTDFQGVPELSSGLTDPSIYDNHPDAMVDPMLMQSAQQAGQIGQKEVFDTAMLSGLLKAVRQDSMVDRYTGDLMKALDRVGRILFLLYWHNEEFMERYGKTDMPELEDTLRNTFEMLGDLLLFLREKDVDPLVGGVTGEPDIQESA